MAWYHLGNKGSRRIGFMGDIDERPLRRLNLHEKIPEADVR